LDCLSVKLLIHSYDDGTIVIILEREMPSANSSFESFSSVPGKK